MINITVAEIITSVILYGLVHGIWTGIKWGLKHLETEAGQIIEVHVKNGHSARLKHCTEDGCIKL